MSLIEIFNSDVVKLIFLPSNLCFLNFLKQSYYSLTIHIQLFLKINLFILFLTALGLGSCTQAFPSCGERGLLFVAVRRLLTAVASLVAEHGFQACGLQQLWHVGSRAQAQQLWLTDLVAPRHVESSRTRARTRVPCIGRQSLNHCATREAPYLAF